jgi:hypothetical protein
MLGSGAGIIFGVVTSCHKPEDLKRFVHLAGLYRRFIADFGSKAVPLTTLLRRAVPWEWGDKQQRAFEGLKQGLTELPLLP